MVDVGPGRGEWLALLAARRIPAHGVDTHEQLRRPVPGEGAPGHPRAGRRSPGIPRARHGDIVTAFHVIEHLDTEELIELILAARQALRPGGCLLLETPNPTNLVMGSCDFYNDPTHRSPLPPDLTVFLVTAHGFGQVEVRHLNPGRAQAEAGSTSDVAGPACRAPRLRRARLPARTLTLTGLLRAVDLDFGPDLDRDVAAGRLGVRAELVGLFGELVGGQPGQGRVCAR